MARNVTQLLAQQKSNRMLVELLPLPDLTLNWQKSRFCPHSGQIIMLLSRDQLLLSFYWTRPSLILVGGRGYFYCRGRKPSPVLWKNFMKTLNPRSSTTTANFFKIPTESFSAHQFLGDLQFSASPNLY